MDRPLARPAPLPRSLTPPEPSEVISSEELDRLLAELGKPYEPKMDRLTR
jgi:hypothetical protein